MIRPSKWMEAIPARIRLRLRKVAAMAAGTRRTPAAKAVPSATSASGMATLRRVSAPRSSSTLARGRKTPSGARVCPAATASSRGSIGFSVSQPPRSLPIPKPSQTQLR